MSEEIQESVDMQVPEVSGDALAAATMADSVAPEVEAPPVEKMLPQSQVNKIVAREVREAAEKARAEMQMQFERDRAQQIAQQHTQAPEGDNAGGMPQYSEDRIRQMIQSEANSMALHHQANTIANEYKQKIKAEMMNDPEFADLYDELGIEQHPDLVLMVNGLDNTAAVVKDIAKNPGKIAQILMLQNSGLGKLARTELSKLSASIKANEVANKTPVPQAPLSSLKPSSSGTSDGGSLTVKELRNQFRR